MGRWNRTNGGSIGQRPGAAASRNDLGARPGFGWRWGPIRAALVGVLALGAAAPPAAADERLAFEGTAPAGVDHFFIDFDVPEGIIELELRHEVRTEGAVLDWGLDGPAGSLGWGGGNTEAARVGENAASRSYLAGPLPAGRYRVVVGEARVPEPPAVVEWAVELNLRTAETAPPEPERGPYVASPPLSSSSSGGSSASPGRWYAGDLHVHSRESGDARPSIDEVAAFAASRGLDFVVLSEHNTVSATQWITGAQARWPALLLVPGIEVTTYDGHAGAFGATEWVDHRIGQPGSTIEATAAAIHAQDALLIVNHPNLQLGDACIGCAWDHALDPAEVDALEVITGGWSPVGQLFYDQNIALWEAWLDTGAQIAAVGGSDDHRAGEGTGPTDSPIGSPTTLIYAASLSVADLRAGLAAGRTVVKLQGPDDPMVDLWPEPRPALGEAPPPGARYVAEISGGSGATLQWVEDGRVVEEVALTEDPARVERRMSLGAGRLRAQLLVDGAPRVLTSHWFPAGDPLEDSGADAIPAKGGAEGCSCAAPRTGPGGWALILTWIALLGPFWLLRRRAQPGRPSPR